MKTKIEFRTFLMIALLFSCTVWMTSCQKNEEVQTFNDVFNVEKIQTLNEVVANSASVNDLPTEFKQTDLVNESLKSIDLNTLISSYEKNIKLSTSDVDLLLKNDIDTYLKVIDQISSLPEPLKNLNLDFSAVKSSPLNKYLLVQKQNPDQYYVDDYYTSVVELQNYMKNYVIQPLKNFQELAEKSEVLKSTAKNPVVETTTVTYVLITSNNNWDMWWTYVQVGKKIKKTKHKGAAGSFPG